MLRNKLWIGVILSIILIVFTIPGFTAYYKYTMESGANFYVSIADKADALENHNEIRQILDDLGNLLVHSKRDDSYPEDGTTGGTLTIPNSALALLSAGTKGDILYCSAANVWSKLSIGTDNQVLVVSTDIPNWEILTSDLLSDVDSICMLDENEAILGDWTVTGSIGGVDTTEFGYLATISAFGASIIDDANEATFKATVNLEIGTDVLAYQAIGIANDNLLEVDDADAVVDDYCKLTANGIVGRSYAEVKTDLGIDLTLYYLKTQIDTQGEVEVLWEVTLATDSELAALTYSDVGAEQADAGLTSLAGLTYVSPSFIKVTATDTYAIRTIAEVKTDLSLDNVENTALSTWAGTESITTLGTITTGIWSGTSLVIGKLPTAVVSDGDTAHVPTSDNVYDFCETTQNYALNSELHNAVTLGTASGLSLDVQELSLAINSSTSAGAVTSGAGQVSKVWKTDADGNPDWGVDEGGVEASTFVALSDTPTFYTDQAGKFPRVNVGEDGMEFYTIPGGGDVIGPATSTDNTIARFDGTDNKVIQGSLATISDTGTINIPLGQTYKINNVSLSYIDVGAIEDAADTVVSSHIDWGSGADQVDTDDVPEGSSNLYQLTGEEVDDYVYALINDAQSVHTLITITYDDTDDAYDFVVTNDLHEYDWTNVVAGDIPDLSAVYQPLDTALTNISALVYVSPSFIKLTANDTYAVRTFAEVKTDLSLNNVENTALSTWVGTESVTTLGTIATGTWEGTAIADSYIPNDITIDLATLATTLTITDNEATAEDNAILFTAGGAVEGGNLNIESDGTLTYNPSTGKVTATGFIGALTGNADTCTTASAGDAAVDFFGAGVDAVTDTTTCTDIEGTLLSITGVTLNVTIPEDHINATMLKDDNAPADGDIFTYELTGTTGHWMTKAELTIASSGANADITSMTGLDDDGIPLAKVANAASDGANSDITSLTGLTTPLGPAYGGTGVANAAGETITLVGDDAITFTTSAATNVTLPTTGTLMANLEEDTDPDLGGELDAGAHSIGFTIQTAGGDGTTTIDWTAGNYFKFTHGAMAETFTFDPAPTNPCHLTLIIIQDGTGGRDSTWPAPVKWLGDEPIWTDGGGGKGIVMAMVYDGTSYWSQGTPWEE